MIKEIDITNIKKLSIDSNLLEVSVDGDTMTVSSSLVPEIVESNFKELAERLGQVERTTRTVSINLQKAENKINVLNAVMQGR